MIAIIQGVKNVTDYGYVLDKLDHLFSKQDHVSIRTTNKQGACKLAALYATLTNNCGVHVYPSTTTPDDIVEHAIGLAEPVGMVLFGDDEDTKNYENAAAKHNIRTVKIQKEK